jgi:hypothetical protein
MQPLDAYSGAYAGAMLVCLIAVRARPERLAAMGLVFTEWTALQWYHGFSHDIAPAVAHSVVDLATVAGLRTFFAPSRDLRSAARCFEAALWLHVAWAINAAYPFGFRRFDYLSIYAMLGYMAMWFIAGEEIRDEALRARTFLVRMVSRRKAVRIRRGRSEE